MTAPHTRVVSFAFLLATSSLGLSQVANQPRITQPIDSAQLVRLVGSRHPQTRPEMIDGRLNGNVVMHGVSLIFKRSQQQQDALRELLTEQQNLSSSQYHRWLTPEQFADRFGLGEIDLAQIRNWLESEGFVIDHVARSKTQISFIGSVARIGEYKMPIRNQFTGRIKARFANLFYIFLLLLNSDLAAAVAALTRTADPGFS